MSVELIANKWLYITGSSRVLFRYANKSVDNFSLTIEKNLTFYVRLVTHHQVQDVIYITQDKVVHLTHLSV